MASNCFDICTFESWRPLTLTRPPWWSFPSSCVYFIWILYACCSEVLEVLHLLYSFIRSEAWYRSYSRTGRDTKWYLLEEVWFQIKCLRWKLLPHNDKYKKTVLPHTWKRTILHKGTRALLGTLEGTVGCSGARQYHFHLIHVHRQYYYL